MKVKYRLKLTQKIISKFSSLVQSGGCFSHFIGLLGIHHMKCNQEFPYFGEYERSTNFKRPAIRKILILANLAVFS